MAEIKIDIVKLEEKIQKLRDLKAKCEEIDVTEEGVSGSGQSITMLNTVDKEYSELKKTFSTLIDNSISFFKNVKESFVSADEKAADKLK